jgi:hypothetical protein
VLLERSLNLTPPAGEQELAEQKQDMSKRDRAKVAAAKPFMKHSSKGCQLHIQVMMMRGWDCSLGCLRPVMLQVCRFLDALPVLSSRLPQATYIAFSDAEEKLIKEAQRTGLRRMLESPEVGLDRCSFPQDALACCRTAAQYHSVLVAWHQYSVETKCRSYVACWCAPQGRQINPHLRNLLQSGTLQVRVPRAEALPVSSILGRPSV